MRRVGGLLEAALEWSAMRAALRRAAAGKRRKMEVLHYEARAEENLLVLRHELASLNYWPERPTRFHIERPKPRWITAATFRDRVAHQVLCAPLERLLDRRLRDGCVANRRGRGVDAGLRRVRTIMRHQPAVLCMDIRAYFASVDHMVLKDQLARIIKDRRYLALLNRIIDCSDHPEAGAKGRGLPIGNLTSQHLGNLYLNPLDQLLDRRRLPWMRYVDDIVVGGSRADLEVLLPELLKQLSRLRLSAHPQKTRIQPASEPLRCLGYTVAGSAAVGARAQSRARWRRRVAAAGLRARLRAD